MREAGWLVRVHAARAGLPKKISAEVVIVALRDPQIRPFAEDAARCGCVPATAVVLHLAGALGPEELDALRGHCRGVGRMHPMTAIADGRAAVWSGCWAHVEGDRAAVRAGRKLALSLGMVAWHEPLVDRGAYHAAGGMVAGGAVALVTAAAEVMSAAGVERRSAVKMLASLLASAAANVGRLGTEASLTGPMRRGDVARVTGHLRVVEGVAPRWRGLMRELLAAQVPISRAIGQAGEAELGQIEHVLGVSKSGRVSRGGTRRAEKV